MKYIDIIQKVYRDDDLIVRTFKNVTIIFFESLCDSISIYEYVIKSISKENINDITTTIKSPKLIKCKNLNQMKFFLENGFCLIFYKDNVYSVEVKANLDRGINTSLTESSMYGPKDSFCENYQKNLGLLKRRIKTDKLVVTSQICGKNLKTMVSLVYINDLVNKKYIHYLTRKLENLKNMEVLDSSVPFKLFNRSKFCLTVIKSEKPGVCADFLLKGYAILLIDNTPFQLILDVPLKEHINYQTHDVFVKTLRYICLFITVLTPAVYIALINYNPETIPISLLVSISSQRFEVPFPSIVEALIMLFVCEILRETDLRFPSAYGSAASILGALIIGEAAVSAGIVSPIMIIIIAITYITSLIFTEIKLLSQIRIMRFILLLFASILGLFGLGIGAVLIINYFCNINLIEREYL